MKKTMTTLLFVAIATATFAQRTFSLGPDYKKEIDSLTTLIKKQPDNADLFFQRSIKVFQFNSEYPKQTTSLKMPDAFIDINKAISIKPDQADYFSQRAEFYEYQDSLDLAIADFTKAIELAPINGLFYKKRATMYVKKTDYPSACADFKKGDQLGDPYCKNFIGVYCR
jgi:tetratricopeptide (TPR) repeat protein